jgi:hypothetical protein
VENPYMRKGAPGSASASVQQRVVKELKTNWWLWGSIVFAVLLVGSLVVFRENLYDSAKHGLPFLAGLPLYTPTLGMTILHPLFVVSMDKWYIRCNRMHPLQWKRRSTEGEKE